MDNVTLPPLLNVNMSGQAMLEAMLTHGTTNGAYMQMVDELVVFSTEQNGKDEQYKLVEKMTASVNSYASRKWSKASSIRKNIEDLQRELTTEEMEAGNASKSLMRISFAYDAKVKRNMEVDKVKAEKKKVEKESKAKDKETERLSELLAASEQSNMEKDQQVEESARRNIHLEDLLIQKEQEQEQELDELRRAGEAAAAAQQVYANKMDKFRSAFRRTPLAQVNSAVNSAHTADGAASTSA